MILGIAPFLNHMNYLSIEIDIRCDKDLKPVI